MEAQDTTSQHKNQDRNRDVEIYKYLLRLTDGYEYLPNERPVEKGVNIAHQWGTDKMFVQRVLWNLYPEAYPDDSGKKRAGLPHLDLDKLVDILASLRKYWLKIDLRARKIQRLDIVKGLRLFSLLTPEQEEELGLQANQSKVILQRLGDSINNLSPKIIPSVVTKLYDHFLSIKIESSDRKKMTKPEEEESINKYLFPDLERQKTEKENKLIATTHSKVKSEESKIKIEDGSDRYKFYNSEHRDGSFSYLSASIMDILIKSVVENEETTSKTPIYFKYIEIKKNRALPLYLDEDSIDNSQFNASDSDFSSKRKVNKTKNGILDYQLHHSNSDNLEAKEPFSSIDSLKNLFSYTVQVHFYIKVPDDKNQEIDNEGQILDVDLHRNGSQLVVNFFEEVSGVGSILSHVITAINRVLLWDIPLLDKYVPIAKNTILRGEHLGSSPNATIWGHNVACLCKRDDVNASIDKNKLYDEVFNNQEYACGDYCGSDILEVLAKSAFYARLSAIEQTGVNADRYIKECLNRIREVNALRKAQSLLNDYPFSLLAMEEYIENNIFQKQVGGKYRKLHEENQDIRFEELSENHWSMVAYEAHLSIAEATLKEGLFIRGKKYLDVLKEHIKKYKNIIDSLFVAKYYLSEFRYEYLVSQGTVDTVRSALEESKKYLSKYTNKCYTIDELPQVNFHNFFQISSRICANEAKIDLFMLRPTDAAKRKQYLNQAIYSFEKARIYAARDGSVSTYSKWSAYQSWCYIMEAYLQDRDADKYADPNLASLEMADVRLDHALVCYSDNGRKCYEAIKTNAGKLKPDDRYNDINIQVIPLIRERTNEDPDSQQPGFDPNKNILILDMSIFSWEYPSQYGRANVKNTLLFGMPSTILLFTLGMRSLCHNKYTSVEEFLRAIKESVKFFNYSWSIAEQGLLRCPIERDNRITYNRKFPGKEDPALIDEMAVMGLYPRRVTQVADFGKIFSLVCYLILLKNERHNLAKKTEIDKKIDFLIKKMDDNQDFSDCDRLLGQTQYNSHFLKEIREKFKKYVEQFRGSEGGLVSDDNDILRTRNKMIRDVFYIVTTQSLPLAHAER